MESVARDIVFPDVSHLVTEDDTPVDNLFCERQMRLLVSTLYASYHGPKGDDRFLAAANVGVFPTPAPAVGVPDVLLAVDVDAPDSFREKGQRSYFVWRYGKPPDVVIEVVSNTEGGELTSRLRVYERVRVSRYVVFDPDRLLSEEALAVFSFERGALQRTEERFFREVDLGLATWRGAWEGGEDTWLRWVDGSGALLPTALERASTEMARAERAELRAESAELRAESAELRAERLAARLRALGVDPD